MQTIMIILLLLAGRYLECHSTAETEVKGTLLCDCVKEWLMLFKVDKCMVMHLGVSNENSGYFMNNKQLEAVVD